MPLFACSKCLCVENTAVSSYWLQKARGISPLCSECDPTIGHWHGKFEKKPAAGMLIDNNGYLWTQEEIDNGHLPKNYKIIGRIPQT